MPKLIKINNPIVSNLMSEFFGHDLFFSPNSLYKSLEEVDENEDLIIEINTGGGDTFAGMEIYNHLKKHKGHVTTRVVGLGASAGSIIAMAGDKIEVERGGQVMIHKCWSMTEGNADDLRKHATVLDSIDAGLVEIYQEKLNLTDEEIMSYLEDEKWFTAKDFMGVVKDEYKQDTVSNEQPVEDEVETPKPIVEEPQNKTKYSILDMHRAHAKNYAKGVN